MEEMILWVCEKCGKHVETYPSVSEVGCGQCNVAMTKKDDIAKKGEPTPNQKQLRRT